MERIKSGDVIQVIAGDDKGKVGKVLRIIRDKGQVVVEGVNEVQKHIKRSQKHPQGGRVTKAAPVHISNVALYDEAKESRVKVRFEMNAEGKKIRVSRADGKPFGETGKTKR